MESLIGAIITAATEKLTEETLSFVIVIALIIIIYKVVLHPMKEKIDEVPDILELEAAKDSINGNVTKSTLILTDDIQALNNRVLEISNNLDKISIMLADSKLSDALVANESSDIKREIADIRNIILQFQGYLIYKSDDKFGNRSIK